MNGGYKEIVQETGNYQEILNTVVGSKVYYMFQEEVHRALKDPNNIELGNKIALDETLQFLWWEYMGNTVDNESYLNRGFLISNLRSNVFYSLIKEGIQRPELIEVDTFEEFLDELKELKFEKSRELSLKSI